MFRGGMYVYTPGPDGPTFSRLDGEGEPGERRPLTAAQRARKRAANKRRRRAIRRARRSSR